MKKTDAPCSWFHLLALESILEGSSASVIAMCSTWVTVHDAGLTALDCRGNTRYQFSFFTSMNFLPSLPLLQAPTPLVLTPFPTITTFVVEAMDGDTFPTT